MVIGRQLQTSTLSPQDAVRGALDGCIAVIDVREPGELAMSGKAVGAIHIPLMRLPQMYELFSYGYVRQACKIAGMRQPRAWSTG